jgi:hypothetical protein
MLRPSIFGVLRIAVVFVALLEAAVTAATAHADCGDPDQLPCAGPVPTVDQVVAIMAELTDPNRPAASKTDIVTPGFTEEEAGTIDDHLHRMDAFGGLLPPAFVVTDIESAPANTADTAMPVLDALWDAGQQVAYPCRPLIRCGII